MTVVHKFFSDENHGGNACMPTLALLLLLLLLLPATVAALETTSRATQMALKVDNSGQTSEQHLLTLAPLGLVEPFTSVGNSHKHD